MGIFSAQEEVLLPSGSAALYRRAMLDEIGGFDEDFFLYCEDTDLGLRARWAGWKCLYVPRAVVDHHYSHSAGRASPLKAYYVERNRLFVVAKNFPAANLLAAPFVTVGAVRVALAVFCCAGAGAAAQFRRGRSDGGAASGWLVDSRAWVAAAELEQPVAEAAGDSRDRANLTPQAFRAIAARSCDQRARGGGAVNGRRSLLILIPAFNEEGAVGGVVRSVQAAVPGTPVLVVDDCSLDGTVAVARAAGAEVLTLPHHLGLGGCVQAGYKLAFELGYEYVIRVDGDGQHDARDIPRIFETLRTSGCEMVIGSRFLNGNGAEHQPGAGAGHPFLPHGSAARFWARRCAIRPPDSWASTAKRCRFSAAAFRWNIRRSKRWWCCSARRFRFEEVPCRMHPRRTGRSSITPLKSIYYIVHVLLGVFVNVLTAPRLPRGNRS